MSCRDPESRITHEVISIEHHLHLLSGLQDGSASRSHEWGFRRDSHPIHVLRHGAGSVGLDGNHLPLLMDLIDERFGELQGRLPSRDNHQMSREFLDLRCDLILSEVFIRLMDGIAEGAA